MAEIGVIASIVGIAGVGIKLSKTLFEIGDKAKSADRNLQRLATNVSLFAQTLKHFAEVMRVNQHLYSPEFEETASQISDECHNIFKDLTKRAVMARQFVPGSNLSLNDSKKKFSVVHRVREYFEQSKVDWLLAQLEYLKTTLSVLIQTLQLAAVTAKAKQDSEELTKANAETIEREKVHIETLIIARQLSILVVLQQNNQQSETAKSSDSAVLEEGMSVSPIESDDSVEEIYPQRLLTEGPANSTSLVELRRGNLKFLDDVIPTEPTQDFPAINPFHNEIIDQLLGRWTRLPEMEEEINEKQRKDAREIDLEDQSLPPYSPGARKFPGALEADQKKNIGAPDLKLQLIDSNDTVRAAPEPIAVNTVSLPSQNLGPQVTETRAASRTPPPPIMTHTTTYPGLTNPSLTPPPSDSPTLHRSLSSPEPEMHVAQHQQMRTFSPQPGNMNTVASYNPSQAQQQPPPRNLPPTSAPLDRGANPAPVSPRAPFASPNSSSRPGSSHQPMARGQYGPAISPAGSLYGSSPDSEYEDDSRNRRLGLGIPWRIRIGTKYWDFLDERLVGPRTPYLPKESMAYLYSHDFAETEVAEKWVCEEAIKERNYSYVPIKGEDQVESRWRITSALKFIEIDELVERTIDIYRRKTTQNQPGPGVSREPEGAARSQPVPIPTGYAPPYANNGPVPPPPQLQQDPAARARADNFTTWQQMNNSQQQRNQQLPRSYSGQESANVTPQLAPPRPGNLRPEYQGMGPASMGADPRNVHWGYPPSSTTSGPPPPASSVAGMAGSNVGPPPGAPYGYPPYQPNPARGYSQDPRYGRDRYEDDDDGYERHKRRGKKEKKKKKGTATAAKVSGLMAVLDSLDALG